MVGALSSFARINQAAFTYSIAMKWLTYTELITFGVPAFVGPCKGSVGTTLTIYLRHANLNVGTAMSRLERLENTNGCMCERALSDNVIKLRGDNC